MKRAKTNARILMIDGYEIRIDGTVIGRRGRPLTARIDSNGYPAVRLVSGWVRIHRLLARAFIPNPLGHETVNHIDGNKENFAIDNLEWMSRRDNLHHAMDTGLHAIGRRAIEAVCPSTGKSTRFDSQAQAARRLGIHQANINRCLKGARRTAGRMEWRYAA